MRFMHTSGCINQQYPLATPIFKDQALCLLATPIFASLKPKKHHLFVPDNQHTDVIIGEMFLKKRGCFFCSLPSISGKTFTEKTGVFPSPPGSPRDGCNDQSGPMGPILLSAVLAASKAMRQQAGGKWGNGVALEKGGERCFRKVF